MLSFDGPFFSTRNESEILEVLEGIKFAGVDCTFNSSDNTCTLVDLPQCGSYLPQILTFDHGPIFIDSAAIEISCNITDFSPKTLSPLGS
jgi:hypothetical protein